MRPGRFHPGNHALSGAAYGLVGSFNEAGAFPPRKFFRNSRAAFGITALQ